MSNSRPIEATQFKAREVVAVEIDRLGIEPIDTDGRLLRLHCGPTSHQAVSSVDVEVGMVLVRLDVLSASHRVMVRHAGLDDWQVQETVACGSADNSVSPDMLPPAHAWSARSGYGDPWLVSFRSGLQSGAQALETAASMLVDLAPDPMALVVEFPGSDAALTGLKVTSDDEPGWNSDPLNRQVSWSSWHLYPGEDPHVVWTETSATLRQLDRPTVQMGQELQNKYQLSGSKSV